MPIIYGIDTDKRVSPLDVRNALVECFTQAHAKELEDLKNYADVKPADFELIKRINISQLLRQYFAETGGDFENPTRDSILAVMDKLKSFAGNFRDPSVIAGHYGEIIKLVECLPPAGQTT